MTAGIDDRTRERARQSAVYAQMRWRDENIRVSEAYRAWADAGTPSRWRAYEQAFDREHEALMRYVELTQRLGALPAQDMSLVWLGPPRWRDNGARLRSPDRLQSESRHVRGGRPVRARRSSPGPRQLTALGVKFRGGRASRARASS